MPSGDVYYQNDETGSQREIPSAQEHASEVSKNDITSSTVDEIALFQQLKLQIQLARRKCDHRREDGDWVA